MRSFSTYPSTFQNLRLLEEVLYDLPPLEGVFLHWHTHGVTATTAGMHSLLARRKQLLGPTTLSGASIQLLYECATDSLRRLSLPWAGPTLSVGEPSSACPSAPAWTNAQRCRDAGAASARGAGTQDRLDDPGRDLAALYGCWPAESHPPATASSLSGSGTAQTGRQAMYRQSCDLQPG